MAVALQAAADHLAGGNVKGGKQRRGAVALVVVRHGAGAPLLQGQPRLADSQIKCNTGYVRGRHGTEIQPPQP